MVELVDYKIKMSQIMKLIIDWLENIVGKGENAGCQQFLLVPQWFEKPSFTGSLRAMVMRYRVK